MKFSRPSRPVRLIKKLPFARFQALRLWNRVQRLKGEVLADTYFGAKMLVDSREIIQASIAHFGVWEPEASEIFSRLIGSGDTTVDIGANIGYYSLLFSHAVGKNGAVVAIEAMPSFSKRIEYHACINNISNIRVVNLAVTEKQSRVNLYVPPAGNNGATTIRSDRGYNKSFEVDGLPLLDILSCEEQQNVVLIKCDIEGAEGPVMKDILNNLLNFPRLKAVAVEANILEVPEWSELFIEFKEKGFIPYSLNNDIREFWINMLYNSFKVNSRVIDDAPNTCADIIFLRDI